MIKSKSDSQKRLEKNTSLTGILLLDKPYGLSSNQALQKVKRLLNVKKAGHSGSLDPMATGMLPILINQATKFSQFLLNSDKTYLATIQLGQITDTGDKEGQLLEARSVPALDDHSIETYLKQFRGKSSQIPPMYSALKKDGRPLYELAREGIEIERNARDIEVYELENLGYDADAFQLKISVKVSKGTYIRTLAEDIGRSVGCGAHLIELRRISCGSFNQNYQMITLNELSDQLSDQKATTLINMALAFKHWPICHLTDEQMAELKRSGRWIGEENKLDGWYVLKLNQKFIGIGEFDSGQLKTRKLLIN